MGLFSGLFKRKNVTSEQNLSVERKAENEKQGILKNYVAQAKGFYENGDGDKAFHYMKRAADGGEVTAFAELGFYYREGIGTKKDIQKAMKYLKMAMEENMPDGYYWMAEIYEDREDEGKAAEYMLKAAQLGDATAQARVGEYYYDGKGFEKDGALAFKWLSESFKNTGSYWWPGYYLGLCYLNGVGTRQNMQKAVNIFERALDSGSHCHTQLLKILADCYERGIGVPVNKSRAQEYRGRIKKEQDDIVELARLLLEDPIPLKNQE